MSQFSSDHRSVADELKSGRWRLDLVRSSVSFAVPHLWGLVKVTGRFERFEATFDTSRAATVELRVQADSVRTGSARRDARLSGRGFLDAGGHPVIEFRSDDVVATERGVTIDGWLSVAGHSVLVLATGTLHDRKVEHELEIEVVAELDQAKLGMLWNPLKMVRTPTRAVIRGTLMRDREFEPAGATAGAAAPVRRQRMSVG